MEDKKRHKDVATSPGTSSESAKDKARPKKATNAEMIQRLSEVKSLLLSGQTRSEILEYVRKSGWNIVDSQVDNYIAKSTQEIKEVVQADTTTDISILIKNLWDLINSHKTTNPQVARQALMDIAKLRGHDQQTVNHIIKRSDDLAKLSEEEYEEAISKAMEQRH